MGKRVTGAVMARWMPSTTREDLPWWRRGVVGSSRYYGRRGGKGPEAWCLVPGAWFPFSRCLVPRCHGGWLRHDIVSIGGGGCLVGTRASRRAWRDAFSNVTALPFRGATPNGGLSHGTSELKPAGATCRPHRPRLRLKLESTEERLGRSSKASWQKGVQDIFQLGLASCFLRPTTSRGHPFPDPTAKRLALANSAVPLSITAAHIIPVGTFSGVFYQEDSSNEWSCSFSFHLTSPNFCPSVTVGTKRPLTSQPRRRRAGPLNPYLHRSHPSQRNETLKHVSSTLVMPLLDRIQVLFSFFSCGQAAVDSERQA